MSSGRKRPTCDDEIALSVQLSLTQAVTAILFLAKEPGEDVRPSRRCSLFKPGLEKVPRLLLELLDFLPFGEETQ
jgi:hypothetical protein